MKRIAALATGTYVALFPFLVVAQETFTETTKVMKFGAYRWALAIGAGIAIGLAALGGAIGQGKVAAAAMEGIARNPEAGKRVLTPMIIALALIESLVIYALVIAFLLQGQI